MSKKNERGAGRRPALTQIQIEQVRRRREDGAAVTALAEEFGVSRQTLSAYLNPKAENLNQIYRSAAMWKKLNQKYAGDEAQQYTMRMDYMFRDELCTVILIDFTEQKILIKNETDELIHRAFGVLKHPVWKDFQEFLEERCFPRSREGMRVVLRSLGLDFYDPLAIIEKTAGRMAEDFQWIRMYRLSRQTGG